MPCTLWLAVDSCDYLQVQPQGPRPGGPGQPSKVSIFSIEKCLSHGFSTCQCDGYVGVLWSVSELPLDHEQNSFCFGFVCLFPERFSIQP